MLELIDSPRFVRCLVFRNSPDSLRGHRRCCCIEGKLHDDIRGATDVADFSALEIIGVRVFVETVLTAHATKFGKGSVL